VKILRNAILSFLAFTATEITCVKTFGYMPKEGNINASTGSFIYHTNFEPTASGASSPFVASPGLIVTGDVDEHGGFEIALFDLHKLFFREKAGFYKAEKTETIHISMGYRRWLASFFAASFSFYSSYTLGEVTTSHDDFPANQSVDTTAHDNTEYGFEAAGEFELWNHDRWTAIVDARYTYCITWRSNEKADTYGALVGIKYFVQGRQKRDRLKEDLP
jgi:hypothetical protein